MATEIPNTILPTMQKVRVSVLLPSLGTPKTLKAAVKSTLFAMGPDDELLVLISGSNDVLFLDTLTDQRLKVAVNLQPMKVFEALNALLEKAKGEYVARMDADDICLPWRFRLQTKIMESQGLDFVFSNSILFGTSIRPVWLMPQLPIALDNKQSGLYLAISNPFVHPTMLARKSALTKLGGYRSLNAEDLDLWLRAWQRGFKFARTAGYGVLYRSHKAQVTQSREYLTNALTAIELQDLIRKQIETFSAQGILAGEEFDRKKIEDSLKVTSFALKLSLGSFGKKLAAFANRLLGRMSL